MKIPVGLKEKMMDGIKKTKSGCWVYGNFTTYPAVCFKGKTYRGSRLSHRIYNGPIKDGLFVLHKCDNPPCVNPKHLFIGTARDNGLDMAAKGRAHMGLAGVALNPFTRIPTKKTRKQIAIERIRVSRLLRLWMVSVGFKTPESFASELRRRTGMDTPTTATVYNWLHGVVPMRVYRSIFVKHFKDCPMFTI